MHHPDVTYLLQLTHDANAALMAADVDRYRALVDCSEDFVLFSPFGGEPTRGMSPAKYEAMRRFFKNGTHRHEVIAAYHAADLVVLVLREYDRVAIGNLPEQEWALRVTLAYRRDPSGRWRLVHRHADPLVHGISHEHAASHASGTAAP